MINVLAAALCFCVAILNFTSGNLFIGIVLLILGAINGGIAIARALGE